MLSGEAANTNFIVFGLTRPGLQPTTYRTRGEHAKDYATIAVFFTRETIWWSSDAICLNNWPVTQKTIWWSSVAICLNNWLVTRETIWWSMMPFILTIDQSHEKQSGQVWWHLSKQLTRHMRNNLVKSGVSCLKNVSVTWETFWWSLMLLVLTMDPSDEKQSGELWCHLS